MNDEGYMKLAIENARAMKGQTAPNPMVGAVIVKNGRIVGIGSHLKPGEPHAEIHALRMAGDEASESTIYVTLEPCSHVGKTGPCAEALIKAGVKKVVIASLDPNPLVAGRGVTMLREAGIEVVTGVLEQESWEMNEVFNHFIVHNRPFVTLKAAMTLDGKTATHTMHSQWITGEKAREDVHVLRSEHQAILVGVQTIIEDDAELTARIPNGRNPIRMILDSTLRIGMSAKVLCDGKAPTWVFTTNASSPEKRTALEALGVKVFVVGSHEGKVKLTDVLQTLGEHAISSVFIEAGGTLNASFLTQQLVNQVIVYVAPKLIGGKEAPTFFEGLGMASMTNAIPLRKMTASVVGEDVKIIASF
ncbi:bifunctional diaminohydroxyphosphoribosylaminopyrimidine deaminase/5-amino-6-(5-phosphoribosylamino)uracil reductase [Fictibacillus macauensis ZFHKF-1]|uniref:Riboflavin biosynthesis protein RibD n=1 Tax=Fictibacillus macauensis ZFHKF-1 TaxID=1196324 RepID=I8AKA4_9BACL|nr:bifunctional diaminohydroxyphosphoribosylaminopyrimidine deaminase/5-amino-6-(5-phosphoribosylamino)uracil reductase RibD [Fictibacillus macauensis]EIT85974.1 bifunctional diaminohydroxyphosphoribosylaminopyrimidine deaminase/5-amino-6-(5-phosphoribosylamino)uracil reductase [Fictibacillus macauensis ZFHKF-1]